MHIPITYNSNGTDDTEIEDESDDSEPIEGDTRTSTKISYPLLVKQQNGLIRMTDCIKASTNEEGIKYCENYSETFVRLVTEIPELIHTETKTYKLQWVEVKD